MDIQKIVTGLVFAIVGFILVFAILGGTASILQNSTTDVATSGLPLANLFASNGVVILVFMSAILIGLVVMAFKGMKHK